MITRGQAKAVAERAHCAAYAFDKVEGLREKRGLPYSEDEEYKNETVYAVNRHNDRIIGVVRLDGTFNGATTLAGLHVSSL